MTMKYFIIFIGFLITTFYTSDTNAADANTNEKNAEILTYTNEIEPDGTYNWNYETSNNIMAQEEGKGGVQAKGSYKYTAPDGTEISMTYTADENGFIPQGSHLPQPPEMPPLIAKALEYIRAHPPPVAQQEQSSATKPETKES